MISTTDGKVWVSAPVGTAPLTTGGVTGVYLSSNETVEWNWTDGPNGFYVSGYSIIPSSRVLRVQESGCKKDVDLIQRIKDYDKEHCWQYDIRLKNLEEDLKKCGLTKEQADNLTVGDFEFRSAEDDKKRLIEFIKRHEWLGTLSQFTTHWFGCYYGDVLAGVILLNVPNSFSKILGDNTKEIERLISRGACISWSPKNLASAFLMWCIKYMAKNTKYRLFTAYSDPTANELGTIYQACNFYYMGQKSGGTVKYINPYTGKLVSDRYFRQKTAYKKFANEMGIEWQKNWNHKTGMNWHNMSDETEARLRAYSKKKQFESESMTLPSKHKYAYVLGINKKETRELRALFLSRNKVFDYPSGRGDWE